MQESTSADYASNEHSSFQQNTSHSYESRNKSNKKKHDEGKGRM